MGNCECRNSKKFNIYIVCNKQSDIEVPDSSKEKQKVKITYKNK
jgi:hypothetical protein